MAETSNKKQSTILVGLRGKKISAVGEKTKLQVALTLTLCALTDSKRIASLVKASNKRMPCNFFGS